MDLLAAWLLFPLVLVGVSLGIGLLLERAVGCRVQGALLLPLGFAGALVVSRALIASSTSADFTTAALLGLAILGAIVGSRRARSSRIDVAPVLAAAGVFLVAGAPIVLSGSPSFGGSRSLPDTSHQLALASFLPEHGLDWQAIEPSSYRLNLEKYIVTAYPVGSQAAFGALSPLGVLDPAWLYQPYLCFVVALISLSLYALLADVIKRRVERGLVAFIAGQPALVVSFALQGSIKEISALAMVTLTIALAAAALRESWSARSYFALAVSAAGALGALGPAAAAYVGPLLVVAVVAWLMKTVRAPTGRELITAVGIVAFGVLLLLPLLGTAQTAYDVNSGTLSLAEDLGNLPEAVERGQATGIWLNGDYRYPPGGNGKTLTVALWILVVLAALMGVAWSVRSRAGGALLLILPLGVTSAYLLHRGSPYADAKVLTILSPAVLCAALLGAAYLRQAGRRRAVAGLALAVVISAGVLASNAMLYHDVQAAPYDRYSELLDIGERLEGRGPTMLTDYDELSQYLLRKAQPYTQPEWPHGYRVGRLDNPEFRPTLKTPIDVDHLSNRYLQSLSAVVIRRSPVASRPPANFERTWEGRYYEIWRPGRNPRFTVVEHLPLARDVFQPGAPAPCREVRRMAASARTLGGRLAYVSRPRLVRITPTGLPPSPGWFEFGGYPGAVVPNGPGRVTATLELPEGRFQLWLEGEFGRGVSVRVGGRETGSVAYEMGNPGQYFPVGRVDLDGGPERVEILRGGGDLRPGNGGGADSSLRHIGPLVFSPPDNERRTVRTVAPRAAAKLCGRSLDWIEVVMPR